jgi:hypothetical protein
MNIDCTLTFKERPEMGAPFFQGALMKAQIFRIAVAIAQDGRK